MKKYIPLMLLIIGPYAYLITMISIYNQGNQGSTPFLPVFIGGFVVLTLCIYLPNMVYAFYLARTGTSAGTLASWTLLIKILFLPAYILFFVFAAIFALSPQGPIFPYLMLGFYLGLLIPSSLYGVNSILTAKKNGLSKNSAITLAILICIPLVDVIATMILLYKIKKSI